MRLDGEVLPVALNLVAPQMGQLQVLRVVRAATGAWREVVYRRPERVRVHRVNGYRLAANVAVDTISRRQLLNGHVVLVDTGSASLAQPRSDPPALAAFADFVQVNLLIATSADSEPGSTAGVERCELGAICGAVLPIPTVHAGGSAAVLANKLGCPLEGPFAYFAVLIPHCIVVGAVVELA